MTLVDQIRALTTERAQLRDRLAVIESDLAAVAELLHGGETTPASRETKTTPRATTPPARETKTSPGETVRPTSASREQAIRAALQDGLETTSAISAATGLSLHIVKVTLWMMRQAGTVTMTGSRKTTRYRLAP